MIVGALKKLAVAIDDVKPDPRNARTGHAVDEIARSLKKYGQRKPIVVNRNTGHIEAGNGTWTAAKSLGWKEIAAVFVEDDPETAIGYGVADNRLTDLSVFDVGALEDLLADVDALEIPGVDQAWLDSIGIDGEIVESPDGEWNGMPSCDQEDESFRKIIVHFRCAQDVDEFSKTIGQKISDTAKFIWHPEATIEKPSDKTWL